MLSVSERLSIDWKWRRHREHHRRHFLPFFLTTYVLFAVGSTVLEKSGPPLGPRPSQRILRVRRWPQSLSEANRQREGPQGPEKAKGQGGEAKKRKLEAPNSESPVASDDMGLKALLDMHSEQMRRMQSQIDGLVAINSSLQARLDDQAESQAQEVKELGEKCNVIELSHWIEQGRAAEYADNMEECLRSIKEEVERIRNGENIYCGCLDNEDWPAMVNDNALLPHFKELADAIQLSNGIQHICIDNIELRPSTLGILFPAMEGKVKLVDMRRIRFPAEHVTECYEIFAASIRRNHALERITWINQISSDEQADLLIKSIIDNRAIKQIRLENCFNQSGVNGCRALVTLMTCGRPFEWLDFGENGLSDIDDVAAALATNPQLEKLFITGNQLNNSDAELIAQALKQNTNLQVLCTWMRTTSLPPDLKR
ncbi:hypothetical protein THAOC_11511 [Thalassiosira oceanica]|uniref:Uncharacterized protein n=1 Tax=Thalassiosira oceanica TaxID=159749 RepID=K0T2D1_THAOC|nr:hypothetical protein THAOC_11511 [Thalassiosira oceanica]|eukprot:EJK67451.1 hypothetical protein THAOC_11511 [Thalassiosira oceanica]